MHLHGGGWNFFQPSFFLWKGVIDMMAIRIVAGLVLVFGADVFIMLMLFNKAIKKEEKRHQIAMKEIKEKEQG